MYCLISTFPLARCKKYFDSLEEVKSFIPKIVESTNRYRKKEYDDLCREFKTLSNEKILSTYKIKVDSEVGYTIMIIRAKR